MTNSLSNTLLEEAVIHSSDEGRNTGSATSQNVQSDFE